MLDAVVQDGTVTSVQPSAVVGVLDAVVPVGTVVSVSPIAIAGMLLDVVGLIKHAV